MTLPPRSEVKEDVLALQRALKALDDAGGSLKKFSKTGSVEGSRALSASVDDIRRKVKKARELGREIAQRWFDSSTY
jgi:hypothetical protein